MTARLPAALIAVALLAPAGRGADDPLDPARGGETTLFRSLLRYAGVTPIQSFEEFASYGNNLQDVVVVMIGGPPKPIGPEWKFTSLIDRVYPNGGAILIATGERMDFTRYVAPSMISVSGAKVVSAVRGERASLGGVRTRPFLQTQPDSRGDPFLKRMAELPRVVSDDPAAFDAGATGGPFTDILFYPDSCVVNRATHPGFDFRDRSAGVVLRRRRPETPGVAVIVPSRGMFANRMLTAKGTDNFAYTYFLSKFLVTTGADGKWRSKCLFIEDGELKTDFDAIPLLTPQVPPVTPPVPSLDEIQDKIVDAVNNALADAQDRDVFGGPVAENFNKIMRAAGPALAALALIVLLARVWAARHGGEAADRKTKSGPELAPFDLRRQVVLKGNDIGGPVREYLRGLFARWGATGGAEMPAIVFPGGREDRKLAGRLRTLWKVAFADEAAVSAERWGEELEPMIAFVTRAAAAGRWKFARPGGEA